MPSAILSLRISKNCEQCKTGLANNSEGDFIVNLHWSTLTYEVIVVRNEEKHATIVFVLFNLVEIFDKADKRLAMQVN